MDIERFKKGYLNLLLSSERDDLFQNLRVSLQGQAGIRTAKLLNFASLCLDGETGEFYVEIGSHKGYTLASAGYENRSFVIGIDHGQREWATQPFNTSIITSNMDQYEGINFHLFNDDFRNVMTPLNATMGVLFIDGDHKEKDVSDAFEWSKNKLSNNAVIILDDLNVSGVKQACDKWLSENKEYDQIFSAVSFNTERLGCVTNPYLANGISVITYSKDIAK